MIVICAWCNKTLSAGQPGDAVSHGICPECADLLLRQRRFTLEQLLEQFDMPVIALDANATVLCANQAAARTLANKADLIKGKLVGDVIECIHARTPGGCGRTIHCSGCTIRRMVTATHQDGRPRRSIKADQSVRRAGEVTSVRYRISTRKIDDVVLLTIEDAKVLSSESLFATEVQDA
jgi:transcriptional regulator with PAS, ATPase and Fis domain